MKLFGTYGIETDIMRLKLKVKGVFEETIGGLMSSAYKNKVVPLVASDKHWMVGCSREFGV